MSGEVAKQDVLPARTSAPLTPARVATGHAHPAEPRTGPESVLALQRMAGNCATSRAIRLQPPQEGVVPEGAGAPLGDDLREDMERRFDGDFADVRVHTGLRAAGAASALSAKAYTVGHDIVFSEGRFAPESHAGETPPRPRARACGAAEPGTHTRALGHADRSGRTGGIGRCLSRPPGDCRRGCRARVDPVRARG